MENSKYNVWNTVCIHDFSSHLWLWNRSIPSQKSRETMQCLLSKMVDTVKKTLATQRYTVRKSNLLYQFHQFLKRIKLEKPKPLWCYSILRMRRCAKILPRLELVGSGTLKKKLISVIWWFTLNKLKNLQSPSISL